MTLRDLAKTSSEVLKRCCGTLDSISGTRFAAQEAEIEGSGRALMRELLQSGAAGAADEVRQHVWLRRAAELLLRMELALRRAGQWVVCTPCVDGNGGGDGGAWRALCPYAAMVRNASGLACTRPGCAALPAEAGPHLRCKGCTFARYCWWGVVERGRGAGGRMRAWQQMPWPMAVPEAERVGTAGNQPAYPATEHS